MKVLITSQFNAAMKRISRQAQKEVSALYSVASSLTQGQLTSSPMLTKLQYGQNNLYTLRTKSARVFCTFDAAGNAIFVDVQEVGAYRLSEGDNKVHEITLFNRRGVPQVYIDVDGENSIYSFAGKPLAYIDEGCNVYGFNGRHLGWFEDGIIWDHQGRRAGFTKATCPLFTQFEPFKGFKQFQPFKAFKARAPLKPLKSSINSSHDLISILNEGR